MKIANKLLVILLTAILAITLITPVSAGVEAAEITAKAGETVVVKFDYNGIGGIYGTFSFSNMDIVESASIPSPHLAGDEGYQGSSVYNEENGQFALFGFPPTDCSITIEVKIKDTAVAGDTCVVTFEYEATEDGDLSAEPVYLTDTVTIKIVAEDALDLTELLYQIARAEGLDENDYTAESWDAVEDAFADAVAAKLAETQEEIDAAAEALKNAIDALVRKSDPTEIDYTELLNQIARANGLDEDEYTAGSWAAMEEALEAAEAAREATTQEEVDAAAEALKNAIDALVEKEDPEVIDYTELNRQIGIAEGLDESIYTEESWAAMEEALEAAKAAREATTQEEVDAAAEALKNAINALVEKESPEVIDYTELLNQIARAEGLNEDDYTEESWAAMEEALEAAEAAREATTQEEVDAAAKALKDAIDSLVEKSAATEIDYTELNRQIGIAEGLDESIYTAESWAAMDEALEDAIAAREATTQEEVDAAAKALEEAIAALVEKEDPEVIDYTELLNQIARAEGLNEDDYTAESWAAMEEALEDAIAAKTSDSQTEVNDAAKALKDAIDALVEKEAPVEIDYTELLNQIARAEGLNEDDYTAESWAAMEEALAAAEAARTATTQEEVDAAAKALKDAIDALVEKDTPVEIDYTELNKQIGIADGLDEKDYTAESWAAMEEALDAAIAAREADTQEEVDAAAKALKDAIAALVKASGGDGGHGDTFRWFGIMLMIASAAIAGAIIGSKKKIFVK